MSTTNTNIKHVKVYQLRCYVRLIDTTLHLITVKFKANTAISSATKFSGYCSNREAPPQFIFKNFTKNSI